MTEPTRPDGPNAQPGDDATRPIPADSTTPVPQYTYPVPSGSQHVPVASDQAGALGAPGVALADDPSAPARGGRKRTGLMVGALATVLALGGAGVFAAQTLSGSGAQPSDVLPGDAYAYLRVDIDPSAGQKIAAVRFLGKRDAVKNTLGSDDPRKKLWEMASKDAGNDCLKKFTYDKDVEPWLGDRVGAAVRPGGTSDTPNVAIAIQVKDETLAKDTLTKLFACDSSSKTDVRTKDGYAIVTPGGTGDATLAAVDKGPLSQNANFTGDMGALGEQGIVSAWFDMATGLKELPKLSGGDTPVDTAALASAKGRFAAAVRFDADYVELAGVVRGGDATKAVKGDGSELANLPANTMAALHVSGADQMLDGAWPQLKKQIDSLAGAGGQGDAISTIEQQLDVKLPDDLKVLLGRSFTIALPDQDLTGDSLTVGAKVVSSNAKRADEIIGRLVQMSGAGSDVLTHKVEGDKVYVATTPDYADDLKSGGKLGDSDAFKLAVGDVTSSNSALFVDLDKLEKVYLGQVKGNDKTFLESLRAVGANASTTGNGEGTFTLRLLGN
ncbi:DUF3352 domain-containing protein [Terrabacter sp. 2RAF25]|uniref:DUF3352 domain-containing protein n=1 Tax=Terrabacter sp. 2RAF25 TaxID=3232998 RepID=UPI003F94F50A